MLFINYILIRRKYCKMLTTVSSFVKYNKIMKHLAGIYDLLRC